MPLETRSKTQSTSSSSSNFALELISALQDPAVVEAFRKARIFDYEDIADRVSAKLSVRLKKLEEECATKNEKILTLEKRIEELEGKADDQEQYSRRTSVRIYGVPENEGEDVLSVTNQLFQSMNVSPTINRVHRVGAPRKSTADAVRNGSDNASSSRPSNSPRPILCQFVAYPDKTKVLRQRRSLSSSYPSVFINEDLTRKRAKILFNARQMKRQGIIKECWSFDGRIAVKDKKDTIVPIHSVSDLMKLK